MAGRGELNWDKDLAAVNWALEKGITTSLGDGSIFSPGRGCTRGEIMTFLYRALG